MTTYLIDIKLFNIIENVPIEFFSHENSNLQTTNASLNLIQRIVKNFKTRYSENKFSEDFGTNLESLFGQFTDLDGDYIKAFLASYLRDYVEKHKAEDEKFIANGGILSEEEQLESIFITKVEYDYNLNGWLIILTVINKVNQSFNISI